MRLSLSILVALAILSSSHASENGSIGRREIAAPSTGHKDAVEGSGAESRQGDTEGKATGYGPDDEDAIEGSGGVDKESVEGSGAVPAAVPVPLDITPSLVTPPSLILSSTSTTTPFPIIRIEERTTQAPSPTRGRPSPSSPSVTAVTTRRPAVRPTPTPDPQLPFNTMLKPGIFAAVVGGTVVGFLMAILLVMFIVYRMRKRDEGSYALEEPKQRQAYAGYAYTKAASAKEFYA